MDDDFDSELDVEALSECGWAISAELFARLEMRRLDGRPRRWAALAGRNGSTRCARWPCG